MFDYYEMKSWRETIACFLIGSGVFLLFLGIILVLGILPFVASPFASQYREGGRSWKPDDPHALKRAVVFFDTHGAAAVQIVGACLAGGVLSVIAGRKLLPQERRVLPKTEKVSAFEVPPPTPPKNTEELVASIPPQRKRALLDFAGAIGCCAVCAVVMTAEYPSIILTGLTAGGAFLCIMLALHHATCRTTVLRAGQSVILRKKNALWSDEISVDRFDGICLAKVIKGQGIVPLSLDTARKTLGRAAALPRVNGLYLSSNGTMVHLPISLHATELLTISESLMDSMEVPQPQRKRKTQPEHDTGG